MISPETKIAVITGGGTGLGKAMAQQLADRHLMVYIIGRRLACLQQTRGYAPEKIRFIQADISHAPGRSRIIPHLQGKPIHYLIHNAAIVTPITPLEKITHRAWRKIQATNVEAPLFLTQQLLPQFASQARILHISSDCAHYPLAHWIPYCTSKAALQMMYGCLKKEFQSRALFIGSVDPGMMDTPMQRYICEKAGDFPEKMSMETLQQQALIHSPEYSAAFCVKLLLETTSEVFSAQAWQIAN